MVLDLLFLVLALLPLIPLSRLRWRYAAEPQHLPVSLERCLYMEIDDGEEAYVIYAGAENDGVERSEAAPEVLALHPQHS